MPLTHDTIDALTTAAHSCAIIFSETYNKVIELGLDEELANQVASIVLVECCQRQRASSPKDTDLATLLARLSPGGRA
jgi:hypothetical protein